MASKIKYTYSATIDHTNHGGLKQGESFKVTVLSMNVGPRRYGAEYLVQVDGKVVAKVIWQGGRHYRVQDDLEDSATWGYVTGDDGGSVRDVATTVANYWINDHR